MNTIGKWITSVIKLVQLSRSVIQLKDYTSVKIDIPTVILEGQ